MKTQIKNFFLLPVLITSLVLMLLVPSAVQAQFNYTITNGTITITGYGGGGAVVIPSSINGLPVTSIGDGAFSRWTSLTDITIPDSVTNIGNNAFEVCTSLTTVAIGTNVSRIGDGAFDSCGSLTDITIPNSVTSIGGYAFYWCTNWTNVTIPKGVTSIGDEALAGCGSTSIVIGPNVTSIGQGVFYWSDLRAVYFRGNAPKYDGAEFGVDTLTKVYYLPGTTGWGTSFAYHPTLLWTPQVQTSDASFGVRTNQFGFNINWASGMTVVVEASTTLENPTWVPVSTNTLTSGSSYFSDSEWTKYPARFYRIRSQ